MELQPGTIFDDRYEIVKLIGEGGMGAIYQARETELGRTVALKLIHRELLTDNDSYTRFRQEGHVLSQLQHEGIVTSYRFGIWQEKTAYIAMELVEGLSMRAAIENQGMSGGCTKLPGAPHPQPGPIESDLCQANGLG